MELLKGRILDGQDAASGGEGAAPRGMTRRGFVRGASVAIASVASIRPPLSDGASSSANGRRDVQEAVHYATLRDVAARIRDRTLSPVELCRHQLARIARLEPTMNAFSEVHVEEALASAAQAEQEIRTGRYRGPLHGVPVAVKDLFAIRGRWARAGSNVIGHREGATEATVVMKLREAGAVLLGTLVLTEGAYAGYAPGQPIPRNPWRADLWPGVSSSGSGVATAAGFCFGAIGTDTGGSIRYPAACNALVGLKPTWGRISRHGLMPLSPVLDHIGPLARTVWDAAAILDALSGADPADPTAMWEPTPALDQVEWGVRGLRVGVAADYVSEGVDPEVQRALGVGIDALEAAGARIVEFSVPNLGPFGPMWQRITAADAVVAHREWYPQRADEYGGWLRRFLEVGASLSGSDVGEAHAYRARIAGVIRSFFRRMDVLICPTIPTPVPTHREAGAYDPGGDATEPGIATTAGVPADFWAPASRFVFPYNLSGVPSLTIPAGFTDDDRPLSLQLVSGAGREDRIVRAGRVVEDAFRTSARHPDLG